MNATDIVATLSFVVAGLVLSDVGFAEVAETTPLGRFARRQGRLWPSLT